LAFYGPKTRAREKPVVWDYSSDFGVFGLKVNFANFCKSYELGLSNVGSY